MARSRGAHFLTGENHETTVSPIRFFSEHGPPAERNTSCSYSPCKNHLLLPNMQMLIFRNPLEGHRWQKNTLTINKTRLNQNSPLTWTNYSNLHNLSFFRVPHFRFRVLGNQPRKLPSFTVTVLSLDDTVSPFAIVHLHRNKPLFAPQLFIVLRSLFADGWMDGVYGPLLF